MVNRFWLLVHSDAAAWARGTNKTSAAGKGTRNSARDMKMKRRMKEKERKTEKESVCMCV
jgi:hypothetical protein